MSLTHRNRLGRHVVASDVEVPRRVVQRQRVERLPRDRAFEDEAVEAVRARRARALPVGRVEMPPRRFVVPGAVGPVGLAVAGEEVVAAGML
jgi:hypothetical protein